MRATQLLIFLAFLFTTNSFGQITAKTYTLTSNDSIVDLQYNNKILDSIITFKSPVNSYIDALKNIQNNYLATGGSVENEPLFVPSSLNLLFAEKIGTVFSNSSDLSFQRAFFNLDASDKSFSIGYNIDNRGGDALKQLNWIISIGTKIVARDGFATISTGSDLEENNIGFNLKTSWVGNGRIAWKNYKEDKKGYENHRRAIEKYREFLYYNYNEKIKEYNKKVAPVDGEMQIAINGSVGLKTAMESELKSKAYTLYEEMIREELEYIDKHGLFTSMWNWWVTFEAYVPLGDVEYSITPIDINNEADEANYYAFNTNISYNVYYENPKHISYFGNLLFGVKGNSNIAVNNLKPKEFQSIIDNNGTPELTEPVSAIAVDEYERFVTPSLKVELAVFYKNKFGFSPSIEKNWGTYDGINWKLGIPISLKPKKGESRVNFELQWRENETISGSKHYIGFSTSFLVGSLVK